VLNGISGVTNTTFMHELDIRYVDFLSDRRTVSPSVAPYYPYQRILAIAQVGVDR